VIPEGSWDCLGIGWMYMNCFTSVVEPYRSRCNEYSQGVGRA